MQKTDKILNAINNIESAINDIRNNKELKNNPLNTLNSWDYYITINRLNKIMSLLKKLKFNSQVKIASIDEIRSIIHSIRDYIDQEEYDKIIASSFSKHSDLTRKMKKDDRAKLDMLIAEYKLVLNSVKKFIAFSKVDESGRIIYGKTDTNNFKFLSQNYLSYKYIMKRVGREDVLDEDTNEISRLETVIYALKRIKKICEKEKYNEILIMIDQMIIKYSEILNGIKKNPKFREIEKSNVVTDTFETVNEEEISRGR